MLRTVEKRKKPGLNMNAKKIICWKIDRKCKTPGVFNKTVIPIYHQNIAKVLLERAHTLIDRATKAAIVSRTLIGMCMLASFIKI